MRFSPKASFKTTVVILKFSEVISLVFVGLTVIALAVPSTSFAKDDNKDESKDGKKVRYHSQDEHAAVQHHGQAIPSAPDIRAIPDLAPNLTVGTIAKAFPDMLHPTQPQTGRREVKRKTKRFKHLMDKEKKGDYPQALLDLAYSASYSPVWLIRTPKNDPRYGKLPFIAYITDKTHGSTAQSELYRMEYGKESLHEPILDKEGRLLNFILVKVMGDLTHLSDQEAVDYMVAHKFTWLEKVVRGKGGKFEIEKITFDDLPNKVWQTTDDPVRGVIGELQHRGWMPRVAVDFFQFMAGKEFINWANRTGRITFDDISLEASDERFEKMLKRTRDEFLTSPEALKVPGLREAMEKQKSGQDGAQNDSIEKPGLGNEDNDEDTPALPTEKSGSPKNTAPISCEKIMGGN